MKHIEKLCALLCTGAMTFSTVSVLPVFAQDDNPTEKEETVYAILDPSGKSTKTIVSSWIHDEDGIRNITETLDLNSVQNVKTDDQPAVDNGTYTWNTEGTNVYYQGETNKALPVSMNITYTVDGKTVNAADMKGKSGHVVMTIELVPNEGKTATVNGKSVTIHPAYLSAGIIDLNNDAVSNLKTDLKGFNDSDKNILAFATIPGLEETLKEADLSDVLADLDLTDTFTLEFDAKDFQLPAIYMAMTNSFSLDKLPEMDSLSGLGSSLDELYEADQQLVDGSRQLAEGTSQLKSGITPLTSAGPSLETLKNAILQADAGSQSLEAGIGQYTQGVSSLNSGNQQLYALVNGISQAQSGADTLAQGTESLHAGLGQVSTALNNVDDDVLSGLQKQLEDANTALDSLTATLKTDQAVLEQLQTSLTDMSGLLTQLNATVADIQTQATTIAGTLQKDAQTIAQDNALINQYNNDADAGVSAIDEAIAALQAADPDADTSALQNAKAALQKAKAQNLDSLDAIDPTQLLTDFQTISTALSGASDAISQAQDALTSLDKDIDTAKATLAGLEQALEQASTSDDLTQLTTQLTALKQGIAQLEAGSGQLDEGAQTLSDGLDTLYAKAQAGIDAINAGSSQLDSNSAALTEGSAALRDGLDQIAQAAGSIDALSDGLTALQEGVDALDEGAKQLQSGNEQFKSEGMDVLKEKGGKAADLLEAYEQLADVITVYTEEYDSFAGAPEGADTSVRFIYKVSASEE